MEEGLFVDPACQHVGNAQPRIRLRTGFASGAIRIYVGFLAVPPRLRATAWRWAPFRRSRRSHPLRGARSRGAHSHRGSHGRAQTVRQRRPPHERELHGRLAGFAGADDAMVRLHRSAVPFFHSSTTPGSAPAMSWRIRPRVFPRQSPSSAICREISPDAVRPSSVPDVVMLHFSRSPEQSSRPAAPRHCSADGGRPAGRASPPHRDPHRGAVEGRCSCIVHGESASPDRSRRCGLPAGCEKYEARPPTP